MSRHIAIDIRMLNSSGIGTILTNVVPGLVERRPDWGFRLLGDPQQLSVHEWSRASNVRVIPFTDPIYSISEQFNWPSAEVAGSDLVWSPNYNVPWRWSGKLMVNVNDVAHLALPGIYGGFAKTLYAKTMFRRVQKRADGILFISQFSADEFTRWVGPARGQTSIVHCGVDAQWTNICVGDPVHSRPYLLFVGNVKPHKNLKKLLQAFEIIVDKFDVDLLIVGKKEGFITGDTAIGSFVERAKGRVSFTGFVEDAHLKQLFAQAQALVLPSLYEGFGLPPLEGMAAGCPALVSRAASMPEVCSDAALYFDPNDETSIAAAIEQVLSDDTLRERLITNGYARAKALSWKASTDGYIELMERIIGGR